MSNYNDLMTQLRILLQEKKQLVLAIDGRCASGKTTLAQELSSIFHASVIHMDDFFLPAQEQSVSKQMKPAGNMDLLRLEKEVFLPLIKKTREFAYQPFSCQSQSYGEPIPIFFNSLLILEGAYCLHPNFSKHYDYRIVLTHSKETQLKRLGQRNTEQQLKNFIERWIPMEENYLSTFSIEKNCDQVINTDRFF